MPLGMKQTVVWNENEKIKIEIPLVLIGTPVGVKDGGIIQHTLHKVEVECFPKDIPSHIDIDISNLKWEVSHFVRGSRIRVLG